MPSQVDPRSAPSLLVAVVGAALLSAAACREPPPPPPPPAPDLLAHCRDAVGPPRVERVSDRVWVARGFDLANVILVRTDVGNVIVDPAMTRGRAAAAREALFAESPGPVAAVIYTHSHIDHTGGAAAFVDDQSPKPPIWATASFTPHFFKQYGLFRPAEAVRAAHQFGQGIDVDDLPCIGIGPRLDFEGAAQPGVRLPDHTFTGERTLTLGGVEIVLVEAPGETHDQLYVWLPGERVLLTGDNYYQSFPNLYTIRGTSNRPVDGWIRSLDSMRRRKPEALVPSHTGVVRGADAVQEELTAYRDAIQVVRDHVVRGANARRPLDEIVGTLSLPPHLAARPSLQPYYGELAWSARGIYDGALGWFDGEPEALYPLPLAEAAALDVALIGEERLLDEARSQLARGSPGGALHLLDKLRRAPRRVVDDAELNELRARALEAEAARTVNTNGRGFLLTKARDVREGRTLMPPAVTIDDRIAADIPLDVIFEVMPTRLKAEDAREVHESVVFEFPDEKRRFVVTVRRGVAEVVEGEALPGTPPPIATLRVPASLYRVLALRPGGTASALLSGEIDVEGSAAGLAVFLGRFERDF